MNRLVIIGNGFDLAHGLKTSYKDFIRWYLDDFFNKLISTNEEISHHKDKLLEIQFLSIKSYKFIYPNLTSYAPIKTEYVNFKDPYEFYKKIKELFGSNDDYNIFEESAFLKTILTNIETKGWTDIESDYYELLKKNSDDNKTCKELNEQIDFLKNKLAEYLKAQKTEKTDVKIVYNIVNNMNGDTEVSQSSRKIIDKIMASKPLQYRESDFLKIEDIMILDFNYTSTTKEYFDPQIVNKIHGSLEKPKYMIFGYGDEMDKDFQTIEDKNNNELLENCKSVKYLETSHYRDLLEFIEGRLFQVYIMGHSCGNSDRTLLNTIFEHENCASIKPFYHKWGEGENDDNYSDITRNIYRNFKNKTLFRDRVVNKEICEPLPQVRKVNN